MNNTKQRYTLPLVGFLLMALGCYAAFTNLASVDSGDFDAVNLTIVISGVLVFGLGGWLFWRGTSSLNGKL